MPDPFGMRAREMIQRGRRFGFRMARAERIEPRVQLQPAFVRRANRERERIKKRLRRAPLRAGEIFRPRLERRGVKRIAHRPHLEQNRVEMQLRRAVEQRKQFRFLLRHRQPGLGRPINVRHRRQPRAAKFPRRQRRHDVIGGQQRRRPQQCREQINLPFHLPD